jgi:hypothetical protein
LDELIKRADESEQSSKEHESVIKPNNPIKNKNFMSLGLFFVTSVVFVDFANIIENLNPSSFLMMS